MEMHGFLEEEEYFYGHINIVQYYVKKIYFSKVQVILTVTVTVILVE
jgi:hypothetical protein